MLVAGGEAYLTFKDGLIDADGTITDESTRKFLQGFVDQFLALVARRDRAAAQAASARERKDDVSCPSDP